MRVSRCGHRQSRAKEDARFGGNTESGNDEALLYEGCLFPGLVHLLERAGIKFGAAEIDHKRYKTRVGEDLKAINGKGYVPVLRLDSGEGLTENVAVLSYIGDLNPAAKLAPHRPSRRM